MRLHIARLILLTLSLLPILLVGRYIAVQGQPVPYWDEWIKPIKNAVKTAEGRITLSDLVQQYVDSRPLFTNLVTVASVLLVDWNLQAEMYFNMLLAGGTLLLLTGIYRRQHGKSADFVILPFSMLIFSLAQHKSWRFSMQSQHFFLILFVVLTFWSIDRQWSKWTSICLAAFFSLCATFSYANGLLLWFVMVPVLWTLNYRQGKYFVFWLMTTLLALGSFFYEYRIHIIGEGIFLDPLALPQFAAAFLGNALTAHRAPWDYGHFLGIASIGGLGLFLFLLNLRYLRRRWEASSLAIWVGLAGFVVASGFLAGLGRGSFFGLGGALVPRYVTLSSVFWLAFAAIAIGTVREARQHWSCSRSSRTLLLTNLVVGFFLSTLLLRTNIRCAELPSPVTQQHRECLLAIPQTRDISCLEGTHPSTGDGLLTSRSSFGIRYRADLLRKIDSMKLHRLGVFSTE